MDGAWPGRRRRSHTEVMDHRPRAQFRFVIAGTASHQFTEAFPELVASTDELGYTVLEGPVDDMSQLAGIVTDFCYRNTWIVRVEELTVEGGR